ncbi:MAG: hypothetical protein KDA58_10215 [Planctomycetaceae bacterium]|nr:hypothetical protein [Planctomycetaceae bacterium]
MSRAFQFLIVFLLAFTHAGCVIGPGQLENDLLSYNTALRDGFREQILLNLVRTRYGESNEYLAVESVATQYLVQHDAAVSGTLTEAAGNILGLSGSTTFNERPTVTYAPTQQCSKFNAQLRRPLSAEVLHYLIDDGFPKEVVLHLAVRRINGLRNSDSICGPEPVDVPAFDRFCEFVQHASYLFANRQIEIHHLDQWQNRSTAIEKSIVNAEDLISAKKSGYELRSEDGGEHFVLQEEESQLMLLIDPTAEGSPAVTTVQNLLELAPDRATYELEVGTESSFHKAIEPDHTDIHISTRSYSGLMSYLAPAVTVPERHLRAGLVADCDPGCACPIVPFRVCVSRHRPKHACVAVPHRGYWFYVDERDHDSRMILRLLVDVARVQLSCEDMPDSGPTLTLPLGN